MAGARMPLALARASHPLPTAAMTAAITALLAAAGWHGLPLALGGLAALTGQLSIGWANDAHDAALDRAAGRTAKPVVAGSLTSRALMRAALAMLVASTVLSLVAAWPAGAWHVVAVLAAWAYDLRLSRTAWSWLPYAVAFACLAPFAMLGSPDPAWPPAWLVVALAAIGIAAHAGNALPDLARDRAAGVGGMATRLGERGTRAVAATGLVIAAACLAAGLPVAALAVALPAALAGALLALLGPLRGAFAGVLVAGFTAIAAIVASGSIG